MEHSIVIYNRKGGSITGVKDVISFDLKSIVLETDVFLLRTSLITLLSNLRFFVVIIILSFLKDSRGLTKILK